jgi:methanogenic corrinoid protein MtbC1
LAMHPLIDHFFAELITGRRATVAAMVRKLVTSDCPPDRVINSLIWPTLCHIQDLHDAEQLDDLAYRYATRILRAGVDQLQMKLTDDVSLERKALVISGPDDGHEVGAQILAHMLEASGFEVYFPGSGVPDEELTSHLCQMKPDVFAVFGQTAEYLAQTRQMIDTIKGRQDCAGIRIALGGGVFGRAEGLAQEMGADVFAQDPQGMHRWILKEFTTLEQQSRDAA